MKCRFIGPLCLSLLLLTGCAVVSVGEFQDAETEEEGEHSIGIGVTVLGVDPTVLEGGEEESTGVMHVPAVLPNELRYQRGISDQLELQAAVWSINWPVPIFSLGTQGIGDVGVRMGTRRMFTDRDNSFKVAAGFDGFGYLARFAEGADHRLSSDTREVNVLGGSGHITASLDLDADMREAIRLLRRFLPIIGQPQKIYGGMKVNAMSTDVRRPDPEQPDQLISSTGFHLIPMPYLGLTAGQRVQSFTEVSGQVYFDDTEGEWQSFIGFGVGIRIPLGR